MRILLVEDEAELGRVTASLLGGEGFSVDRSESLDAARRAVKSTAYDLVLLDRRLPDGDGLAFLPSVRELQPQTRVMVLSALDSLDDTVSGLDAGADDYVAKPFRGPELLARVRACLRRSESAAQPVLRLANVAFEPSTKEVSVEGRVVTLQRRELDLLEALMRRTNRVATRETLLADIYGEDDCVQPHSLETLVWRLRRRLDACGARITIHLARGIGYMLTDAKI